ncbi:MAG: hypothetical protein ABIH99_00125, partial [Candidatus Micrarchaeota archaeon]
IIGTVLKWNIAELKKGEKKEFKYGMKIGKKERLRGVEVRYVKSGNEFVINAEADISRSQVR